MSSPSDRGPHAQDHRPSRRSTRKAHAHKKSELHGKAPPAPAAQPIAPDERRAMIAEAAYYRAQRRGFEPGYELDDWYGAERDIERALDASADLDAPTRCG